MKTLILTMLMVLSLNVSAVTYNQTTLSRLDASFLDVGVSHWDTTTDLEWLDFGGVVGDPMTFGHSINSAEAAYGVDNGDWRLAEYTEVYALFDMFFPTFTNDGDGSMAIDEVHDSELVQARNSWLLSFGSDGNSTTILDSPNMISSRGFYLDELGLVQEMGITLGGPEFGSILYGPNYSEWVTSKDEAYSNYGVFMVRDYSPVPVPATIWLMLSGLIGLVGFARRKV